MILHRGQGNEKRLGDLLVAQSQRNLLCDFMLAFGEALQTGIRLIAARKTQYDHRTSKFAGCIKVDGQASLEWKAGIDGRRAHVALGFEQNPVTVWVGCSSRSGFIPTTRWDPEPLFI